MTAATAAHHNRSVDVLLVARPGDRHADAVAGEFTRRGAAVARTSLDRLRTTPLTWQPGQPLLLTERDATVAVDAGTTAWWPGRVGAGDLDPDQASLAQAEGAAILQGSLRAAVGRWVDPPPLVDAAEDKLYQLHTAHNLGVAVPDTLVTSDPATARAFAAAGPVLAKAVSTGSGIAPFADTVPASSSWSLRARCCSSVASWPRPTCGWSPSAGRCSRGRGPGSQQSRSTGGWPTRRAVAFAPARLGPSPRWRGGSPASSRSRSRSRIGLPARTGRCSWRSTRKASGCSSTAPTGSWSRPWQATSWTSDRTHPRAIP